MGMFDSVDVQYLRRLWYEVYCAAREIELNVLSEERTFGEYYVSYEFKGKRYLTPFSGPGGQREFARSLQSEPDARNIKLALIMQISPAELIGAIRAAARSES